VPSCANRPTDCWWQSSLGHLNNRVRGAAMESDDGAGAVEAVDAADIEAEVLRDQAQVSSRHMLNMILQRRIREM
jgi:hypothetical protein